jgi:radical SAM-linked protein
VSIALPLSVGVESCCELLDFELDGQTVANDELVERLNAALVDGVKVLNVYDNGQKLKHLALLDCVVTLEYDAGVPMEAGEKLEQLFSREEVTVEKKSKNGITQQNIIPMIRRLDIRTEEKEIRLEGLVCCQNPTLNPMQLIAAIQKYLPELAPDFASCRRREVYDEKETVFR